ncbi:MAG TPA: GTP-binding protein [Nitrospiraceae bacterium]|nr:GTP-binding protein [Nitrospiraceae bacterium]HCZ11601.1 GTP-binding protein [Nitrospiraceae bacterium]
MTVNAETKAFLVRAAALILLSAPSYADAYVTGRIIDAVTQKPVSGAAVVLNNETAQTDEKGKFTFKGAGNKITVKAHGYMRAEQPVPSSSFFTVPVEIKLQPFTPKALYLTFYGVGDRTLRESALKLINETELNSLVIDVKGDRGLIAYKSSIPLASEVGAQKPIIVKDIKGLIKSFKEKGIYTIARIVVFKDNTLGAAKPDWTIRAQDGGVWRDRENLIWVDPFKKEVWDYNIDIAVEAARNGFDEIQFDYVRFPDKNGLGFSMPNTEENRIKAITGFLAEAKRRLALYNVFIAADIFGYVAWNLNDTQIGQKIESLVPHVDYISLMLYPSGFQFGIPGYRNPVANPYNIVYLSLKKSQQRTQIHAVRFRPWLQAFKDYAFDRRHFTGQEIRDQIKAAEEFGAGGWMLWNPRNVYSSDGLKKKAALSNAKARPDGSS